MPLRAQNGAELKISKELVGNHLKRTFDVTDTTVVTLPLHEKTPAESLPKDFPGFRAGPTLRAAAPLPPSTRQ